MANGRFNTVKKYIEERFALNLLYFSFIVVGNTYKTGYFLINKDVLNLNN
jgi:hypothetical protein